MPAAENKRPVSLRISVTDRCQLRCAYCLPSQGRRVVHANGEILRDEEILEFVRIIGRVAPVGKIRLTGGEPLLRPGLVDLIGKLRKRHNGEIALTTNGQLLSKWAAALKSAGLDRINLSFDSLDEKTFADLTCGGSVALVHAGIAEARRCGFAPVKLNMVVLRGVNDREILPMVRFALAMDAEVRFLELMPIGTAAANHAERFFPTAEVQTVIESAFSLRPIARPDGSTSRSWELLEDGRLVGRVGFISANSHPFCADCRRLRLTADGRLLGCLALEASVPVRDWLSGGAEGHRQLEAAIADILAKKTVREAFRQPKAMAEIGG
jgi:GTP 3',8-cyclase